jgi:phenylalanyl-tRNA synthetase beta chain
MKISLNWLKSFIKINKNSEEIESILTDIGLEVDEVISIKSDTNLIKKLIVGEIIEIEKHPNADRLNITKVNFGNKNSTIVCGAKNIEIGQKVVVAQPGITIKNIDGEEIKIKKAKIRGVESEGMICSENEIGIGNSHSGIIVLENKAKIGESASKYLETINDTTFDISLTPNRADAASHLGVARDIKAATGEEVILPDISSFKNNNSSKIEIDVNEEVACPRYAGCIIEGVEIKESPRFIKDYLNAIGVNPINNVVDITNFVLHGIGQPLHAFDLNNIKKNKIIVKYAKKNEKFITLDGEKRSLNEDDLMICDGEGNPMCIAGVFGGEKSGVTKKTSKIFLESAYFKPSDIRTSSQNHQLKTDASYRFERGIDPNITIYALKYAASLICKYCNGSVTSQVYDLYPKKIDNHKIEFDIERINLLSGHTFNEMEIIKILKSLDIEIEKKGNIFIAEVPPFRVDVTREADILEEILRVYGYNNLKISKSNSSDFLSGERKSSKEDYILNKVFNTLTSSGFFEITTNSLTANKLRNSKFWDDNKTVEMINKLSDEHAILKQKLLFTSLESIRHNINRKQKNLKFFEFDKIYTLANNNYKEVNKIGIYITGLNEEEHFIKKPKEVTFFDIMNIVNKLLTIGNINHYDINPKHNSSTLDMCVEVNSKDLSLCEVGKIKKEILSIFDISQDIYYAEFDWKSFLENFNKKFTYKEIPKFPQVQRDLSLIIRKEIKFRDIKSVIDFNKLKAVKKVSLYDIYEGESIGKGKIVYSLRFILQDENKTLGEKEINSTMENLIKVFERKLDAEIRK